MPVQNYLRGAPMPGQDLPEIGNLLQRKYAVDAEQQRRNALLELDQQEVQAGAAMSEGRALYDAVAAGIDAGDPQAFEMGFAVLSRVAPVDPRAVDLFKRNPANLKAALARVVGVEAPQGPPAKPSLEQQGGYTYLWGEKGVVPGSVQAPQRAPQARAAASPSPKTETPKPAEPLPTSALKILTRQSKRQQPQAIPRR